VLWNLLKNMLSVACCGSHDPTHNLCCGICCGICCGMCCGICCGICCGMVLLRRTTLWKSTPFPIGNACFDVVGFALHFVEAAGE
jgi:hypothetical protein